MGTGRTEDLRKDVVRIGLTSGLSRRQVADDLGVGFSTLNEWVSAHRDTDVVSAEDRELSRENERLRRKVRILMEESREDADAERLSDYVDGTDVRPASDDQAAAEGSDEVPPMAAG